MNRRLAAPSRGALLAFASLLALAACNRNPSAGNNAAAPIAGNAMTAEEPLPAPLPMQSGEAAAPTRAPTASALPAADPAPVSAFSDPAKAYAYLDAADAFADATNGAPPDYAFDYNGVSPWGWQSDNGGAEFVEPVAGGYRYYYYRPGAAMPYLVRDPNYSYAYDGNTLVAIYSAVGALLPATLYGSRAEEAARYRQRGERLYRASRDGRRRGVVAGNWQRRRGQIADDNNRWQRGRAQNPDWSNYHRQNAQRETQRWQSERQRRQESAQNFDQWRARDFHGEPPPPAKPAPQHPPQEHQRQGNHGLPSAPSHGGEPNRQDHRAGQPNDRGEPGRQGQAGDHGRTPSDHRGSGEQGGPSTDHGRPDRQGRPGDQSRPGDRGRADHQASSANSSVAKDHDARHPPSQADRGRSDRRHGALSNDSAAEHKPHED
ncbi:MAG TPA: hypothetical protein VFL92_12020 [Sphingomonas sp.]|nr:hypothetical protein [Sphingomonas sp.]